jgi:hypothetical protein
MVTRSEGFMEPVNSAFPSERWVVVGVLKTDRGDPLEGAFAVQ